MNLRFIVTYTENRIIGNVFVPYMVTRNKSKGVLTVHDRVMNTNIATYEPILTPEEVFIVKTIEEYNEPSLQKLFSKKKETVRQFLANIEEGFIKQHIKPYVEKRMEKCVDVLINHDIPLYHKYLQNTIYEDEKIHLVEEEGSAVFNFIKDKEGLKYFLTIEHNHNELKITGKEGQIAINDPCCLILEDKMFVLRNIDGKKLMPFFDKDHIKIPAATEKKYFESFVKNAIKKYKVNVHGFTIKDDDNEPEAILSVEKDLKGRFTLILKFVYNKKHFYFANKKTDQRVTVEFKDGVPCFTRYRRDYAIENQYISTLLSLGLVNKEFCYFQPLKKSVKNSEGRYAVMNWVNNNSKALKEKNIKIAQNALKDNYYTDQVSLDLKVSDKRTDWFDIEAYVDFGEMRIPFSSFYRNILDGEREYKLPDGQILILPEEWFADYKDLLRFAKIDKEQLILDKQHFSLLNQNISGVSKTVKKDLISLIQTDSKLEEVPKELKTSLRKYQREGYSWMYNLYKNNFGGCLADDMGLGKTVQALAIISRALSEVAKEKQQETQIADQQVKQLSIFETETSENESTVLIVVPGSLINNWINEAAKFTPHLKVKTYAGYYRGDINTLYKECDVIITSYGIVRNDLNKFIDLNFFYILLDESQMIKNPSSKTFQAVTQLKSENRLVLTGTPIENSLIDLWAQITFLNPGLLGSYQFFKTEFQIPIEKHHNEHQQAKLKQLISPFVLRRQKKEIALELPDINEQVVYCDLNEQQESYYESEKSKVRRTIIEKMAKEGLGNSTVIILQSLMRLRQIANHPSLIDDKYHSGSGKFDVIIRNIKSLCQSGHRLLIFSSFVKYLDLVAHALEKNDIEYAMITGGTKDREKEIKKFQENDNINIFLISLKAGGVGLNLTKADYVFILDPWWNPAAESQAIGRAHRIGQTKKVFVYRFISRNTLEEKILLLQNKKNKLADSFINNGIENLTESQILELFA